MRRSIASLLAAALLLPAAATAQTELRPGIRVRVAAPGVVAGTLTATVIARTPDSVTVGAPDVPLLVIPMRAITALDVSRGSSRSAGAQRGVVWGAGLGVAISIVASTIHPPECTGCQRPPRAFNFSDAIAMTAGSVIWGAGIGAWVGREHWERLLPVPATVSAVVAHEGRPSLGARLSF